jgi:hypothetical protein
MLVKNEKKNRQTWSVTKDKTDRARKKAVSAATNEGIMSSDLKNR